MRTLNVMTPKIFGTKVGIATRKISEDGMSAEFTTDIGTPVWYTCRSADEAEFMKHASDLVELKNGELRLAIHDRFYP